MQKLYRGAAAFLADRRGITALEYGIVASWLAFVIIAAFAYLARDLSSMIGGVASGI